MSGSRPKRNARLGCLSVSQNGDVYRISHLEIIEPGEQLADRVNGFALDCDDDIAWHDAPVLRDAYAFEAGSGGRGVGKDPQRRDTLNITGQRLRLWS